MVSQSQDRGPSPSRGADRGGDPGATGAPGAGGEASPAHEAAELRDRVEELAARFDELRGRL